LTTAILRVDPIVGTCIILPTEKLISFNIELQVLDEVIGEQTGTSSLIKILIVGIIAVILI
jgi:hypothetical protein